MFAGLRRRSFLAGSAATLLPGLGAQVTHSGADPAAEKPDDFVTELYQDRIAAVLGEWSSGLRQTPRSLAAIEKSLASNFVGASLVPAQLRVVRHGQMLEVRRIAYSQRASLARTEFLREADAWLGGFSTLQTAEFQVTAIDERRRTRVRYELVGSGAGFHREQRVGYWRLNWSGEYRLLSLVCEGETRSRSVVPWYTDVTEQTIGPSPMLRGVDYWRTVLDGASGIDIYGHNGVSAGDIDNSGFDSIYVCQPAGLPNRLYRNNGDGTFEDITRTSGVDLLDNTACALLADFDNDGKQDLLIVRATGPLLFINQGGGKFRMQPDAFRFAAEPRGTFMGAAAADYDRDGRLDVYFCLYTFYQGAGQYNYPTPYYAAENGPANFLMRNNGDGTFRDVTVEAGLNVNNTRYSFCCGWGDCNGDGWPDLYVVNDFGRKNLYRNNGNGTFTDVAAQNGAEDTGAGMGVCWFDYDNDGAEDLYVADMWTAAGERISSQESFQRDAPASMRALYRKHAMGNSLFRNRGDGSFENKASLENGGMGRWAWSCDAWDFDHDGFPDVYVANGMISGPAREDLNSFFWRQVVGNSPETARPAPEYEQGWNAVNEQIRADQSWSGYERNVFYANNRDGTFSEVSGALGLDFLEDGRAFALADFDHDGRVEVLLKNRNAPELRLLKNIVPDLPPSVAFRLRGTLSHRDAIGAVVTVETASGKQVRRVQAGSGFLSQHSKELVFGLGAAEGPVRASIQWPSGTIQMLGNVPVNHRIMVVEGDGEPVMRAFRNQASNLPAPTARHAEQLPTTVETWLLAPVPAPGMPTLAKPALLLLAAATPPAVAEWPAKNFVVRTAVSEGVYGSLFRYLFDRRRDVTGNVAFLIDEAGEIVKVYQGDFRLEQVESDCLRIPRTGAERLARALPLPGNAETYAYGRNHLSLGSIFFERGNLPEAEAFFRVALREDKSSAEAHYGLGSVYLKQEKLSEARASFEQAVRLRASYSDTGPNAWNNLGLLATREGRTDEAIRCFQEALKLSPDYWTAIENLGNAYRQQGRWQEARAALEHALALLPREASSNYSLAMVFAQTDDAPRAEELLRRALDLRENYPEALNNLGILYLRTGRRDEAVAKFEESIRLAPAFDQAYLNLARVYALEKSPEKAREVLRELLRRQPGHQQAVQLLEQLR